ncbi:MAG: tetratricopeptide repeat protein [candidate division Zixibacteria bacterium]|nr:tetratricopeptide repeat protein [candidate division Zixibacteria bacterium]
MNRFKDLIQRPVAWGIITVLIAISLRTIFLIQSSHSSPFFYNPSIDALYHHLLAIDFTEGSYSITGPFFRAPLYPIMLGILYLIFGVNLFIASMAGHVIGIFIVLLIFLIGKRYFGKTSGVVAAIIYALYWPALYFEGQLLVDTLFSFLTLASVYFLLLGSEDKGKYTHLIISGFLLGLSAITRANILIFFPVATIWLLYRIKDYKKTSVFLITAFMAIMPVTMINYFVGNDTVLIASQGGINFYIGNNENADGMTANLPEFGSTWEYDDCKYYVEQNTGKKNVKPSEVSSFYYKKGIEYILRNPLISIRLAFKKVYHSINNFEISNNQSLYFAKKYTSISRIFVLPFTLILGFAVYGKIITGLKRTEHLLLWLISISIWLTMILFFVTSRFRLPLIPYLSLFAGHSVVTLYSTFKKKDYSKRFIIGSAVGLATMVFSVTNFTGIIKQENSQAYFNLGNIYLKNHNWDSAAAEFKKAIDANHNVSLARLNIGNLFFFNENYDSAVYYYNEEKDVHPLESRAYLNLSTIELMKGNYGKAAELSDMAIAIKPNLIPAAINLLTAHLNMFDTSRALAIAGKYINTFGNDSRLLFAIGKIYHQQNVIDSAVYYYEKAIQSPPKSIITEYNLSDVYTRELQFSSNESKARLKASFNLATIDIQKGKHNTALIRLLNILQTDSAFYPALINTGLIYDSLREYKPAIKYLQLAAKIRPNEITPPYNLGIIYAKTGEYQKSKESFQRTLSIDSTFTPASDKLKMLDELRKIER